MGDQVSCRRVSAVCVPPEDEFNIPRLRGDVNVEKFFAAGRPAILTDVLNKWPCKDWSLDWLSATLGHHSVEVSYKDCCGNVEGKEKMTLSRFLSEFAAPRSDFNQGPVPYVSNFDVFGLMPELREQLPASELFSARRSLVIYGGGSLEHVPSFPVTLCSSTPSHPSCVSVSGLCVVCHVSPQDARRLSVNNPHMVL